MGRLNYFATANKIMSALKEQQLEEAKKVTSKVKGLHYETEKVVDKKDYEDDVKVGTKTYDPENSDSLEDNVYEVKVFATKAGVLSTKYFYIWEKDIKKFTDLCDKYFESTGLDWDVALKVFQTDRSYKDAIAELRNLFSKKSNILLTRSDGSRIEGWLWSGKPFRIKKKVSEAYEPLVIRNEDHKKTLIKYYKNDIGGLTREGWNILLKKKPLPPVLQQAYDEIMGMTDKKVAMSSNGKFHVYHKEKGKPRTPWCKEVQKLLFKPDARGKDLFSFFIHYDDPYLLDSLKKLGLYKSPRGVLKV